MGTHIDLVYAPQVKNQVHTVSPVNIVFKHALSQIGFTVKTDAVGVAAHVTVTDISLKNMGSKGSFEEHIGATPAWTMGTEKTNYTVFCTGEQVLTEIETPIGGKLLPIPQGYNGVAEGDPVLVVKWKFANGGAAVPDVTDQKVVYLNDVIPTALEMNKKYTIGITITMDEITFCPTITDWTDGGIHNVTIPEI